MERSPSMSVRTTPVLDRPVGSALAAWIATLGVDLLLHGGLLAPLYDWESGFLLAPEDAFVRIPAGYLAFLVLAAGLVWLLPRLGVRNATDGVLVAGLGGGLLWGALLLGLWSITAADEPLLLGWWAGETVQLVVAGYLIGSRLGGMSLRSVSWIALGMLLVGVVTAVVLQSTGYAPAPVRIG